MNGDQSLQTEFSAGEMRLAQAQLVWWRHGLGTVLGAGFTYVLFYGMSAYLGGNHEAAVEPFAAELSPAVYLAPPPPPPMRQDKSEAQAEANLLEELAGFEASPSDSPVKILASPPSLGNVFAPEAKLPPIKVREVATGEVFKPKIEPMFEREHVFQTNEVDKAPEVVSRSQPVVPPSVLGGKRSLRVEFIFVVDENGIVGTVRVLTPSGSAEYDKLMAASVKEWRFSPAVRKGKAVRCLIKQPVDLTTGNSSPFSI